MIPRLFEKSWNCIAHFVSTRFPKAGHCDLGFERTRLCSRIATCSIATQECKASKLPVQDASQCLLSYRHPGQLAFSAPHPDAIRPYPSVRGCAGLAPLLRGCRARVHWSLRGTRSVCTRQTSRFGASHGPSCRQARVPSPRRGSSSAGGPRSSQSVSLSACSCGGTSSWWFTRRMCLGSDDACRWSLWDAGKGEKSVAVRRLMFRFGCDVGGRRHRGALSAFRTEPDVESGRMSRR